MIWRAFDERILLLLADEERELRIIMMVVCDIESTMLGVEFLWCAVLKYQESYNWSASSSE